MKKFLKITAVIVLLLLIFFVGTFKYRQYQANEVSIPKNATSLVKISIDEIYKSLAANMISNPGFYFQLDKKATAENKENKFDTGLKIPASIYCYTIEGKPKTAIFSRLAISDFQEFSNFIRNTLKLNITKASGLNLAQNNLKNFTILFNDEYAAIVITAQRDEFETVLKDILNERNFIKVGDSKFNVIKKSTDHLAFIDKDNKGYINFENGEINFDNEFLSKTIIPAKKPFYRKFNTESAVSFWLNANFAKADNKTYKLKNASLERDSLLKYYKGYLDFEWINTTQQTDSVITYEYNDDFEKVEKISLQKRAVPKFILNISADAVGLKNYLNQKNIIKQDTALVNKAVFPLYKVFVGGDTKQLTLSTKKYDKTDKNNLPSNDFLSINIDFIKVNKQISLPFFTNSFKSLSRLDIKGKVIENGKIKVDGKLELVNKDINSLYQLLKGF
ncbi:hypothetical protein EZ449_11840 [Pedobacter frigidisoli]|uniref:Uncharacterized protein n=1 Tax=Pedobacter frigidisoli TaxID=2530455 RepID=A0A4R0P020_9SPHI|nr:hypothetical protein [Pedobacter frigidisoli]TCD08529.1 hypothetical protein EZ449_11840 [Pedobacter frigidisoli]